MSSYPRIIVGDRSTFENGFEAQRRFCLLSIRRPGTRLVHCETEWAMLSRLDLMIHEWQAEHAPFPCPPVQFQARQAMKLVDWLQRIGPTLRCGDIDVVIQSEHASPQVSAIARVVSNTLGWSIVDEVSISPHRGTQVMLEMAFDAVSALGCAIDPMITEPDRSSQTRKLAWLGQLFQFVNVQFVILANQSAFTADDQAAAKRARELLLTHFGDRQLSSLDREVLDFITRVMLLRGTRFSPCFPSLEPEWEPEVISSNSILIADSDLFSKAAENTALRWTSHCFYEPGQLHLGLKSILLRRGAWLMDSPAGAGRLLSISWRPEPSNEILHERLRHADAVVRR